MADPQDVTYTTDIRHYQKGSHPNSLPGKVLIIHVWPEPDSAGRVLCPDCKPISDECEEDVWDRIRALTTMPEVKRDVLVMLCPRNTTMVPIVAERAFFQEKLGEDKYFADRVKYLQPEVVTREIWVPLPKHEEKGEIRKREIVNSVTLACALDAESVAAECLSGRYSALVIWHPEECEDGSGDLKYLPYLKERGVRTPIYVFHNDIQWDRFGVEIDGDANRAYRNTANGWQSHFHTKTQALTTPETVDVVVRGLCNVGNISIWGALPKHGKSYLFLSVMKALLSGQPWLDYFEVSKSSRVVYLVPEVGLRGVMKRLRKLRMVDYLYDPVINPDGCLYLQTLSSPDKLKLDSAALLLAVKGADVFVDPLIRYIEGDENNATDQRILSGKLLDLISAQARSVWCAHHSPKAFKDVTDITTQNVLRGTGEFAAFPDIIFGVLKTSEEASRLYIKCTDARDDDEHLAPFEVEMRPWIDDTGDLKLVVEPGTGTPLSKQRKAGRKVDPDKQAKLDFLKTATGSLQQKADALNKEFGSNHGKSTVKGWMKGQEFDGDKE